jgi:hypothetical protein
MDTAANCAEPANVVADMTTGATGPIPASRARKPNGIPNAATATASGQPRRNPGPRKDGREKGGART